MFFIDKDPEEEHKETGGIGPEEIWVTFKIIGITPSPRSTPTAPACRCSRHALYAQPNHACELCPGITWVARQGYFMDCKKHDDLSGHSHPYAVNDELLRMIRWCPKNTKLMRSTM